MKAIDISEFFSSRGGGVRSHLSLKHQYLCQLGHEQLTVAPGSGSDQGVRYVGGPSLPYDPTYHLLWRFDKVSATIKEENPEVVEVHSPYLATIAALYLTKIPKKTVRTFFWHADFIDTYLRPPIERFGGLRWGPTLASGATEPLWAWVRAFADRTDGVLVASKTQAEKLRSHGVEKVHIVPFGVDRTLFTPKGDIRPSTPSGPTVVALGRFAVEKEWDVVLDAFRRFQGTHGGRLLCFGDGPERARIQASVRPEEPIELMGFEKDRARLAAALREADLFLHACRYETFGLSIAEAQASGLPVVVPDEGGAFEQLDRRSGASFRAGDAAGAADAMVELLSRPQLRERAREVAQGVRGIAQHFDELIALYERLLKARA